MWPIEHLYRLTPRDAQSAQWGSAVLESGTTVGATNPLQSNLVTPAPQGYLAQLTSVVVFAGAGPVGPPTINQLALAVVDPGGRFQTIMATEVYTQTNNALDFAWTWLPSGLIVPPDYQLAAFVTYSAGNANNSVSFRVTSVAFPRGNYALFS